MFFSVALTVGGRPTTRIAISSSKPALRVAVTVAVIGWPGMTCGASNFAASVNGGFALIATPSCVSYCGGGYGRLASVWFRTGRAEAVRATTLPLIVALPWMTKGIGPGDASPLTVMVSVPAATAGLGGVLAAMASFPLRFGLPSTVTSIGPG